MIAKLNFHLGIKGVKLEDRVWHRWTLPGRLTLWCGSGSEPMQLHLARRPPAPGASQPCPLLVAEPKTLRELDQAIAAFQDLNP